MALVDLVKARYSTQHLVELTNPNVPGAVVIDDARLAAAAADAAGDFLTYTGVALDLTIPGHVGAAVRHVHAYLLYYMDPAARFADLHAAQAELGNLRSRIGAGVRVTPTTNIQTTPSVLDTSGGPVLPPFDDESDIRFGTPDTRRRTDNA